MSQTTLFDDLQQETTAKPSGPVTCLGQTFVNDDERRKHFTALLREKLKDPEFRKIEGFPHGEDEDILNLSDPPYYTACPNPWLADFIAEWEAQKPAQLEDYHYHREPFAADVSEGKHDPIYRAHPYHTKVPHKAIMRYILHYTNPGDIVFDGFCGTGMTGVAAQMCGNRNAVVSLGYQVKQDGTILIDEIDDNGKVIWVPFSLLGARKAILNDLSPSASMISYCYTTAFETRLFEIAAKNVLDETEKECGWLFETSHIDGHKGKIIYSVWSDVFVCQECANEVVFWEAAIDEVTQKVFDKFQCPHCSSMLTKRNMERAWTTSWDSSTGDSIKQTKIVPVLINYAIGGKRYDKAPDANDLELFRKIESTQIPYSFPSNRMMEGKESRRNDPAGITHVHHFYTKQNLWFFAAFLSKALRDRLPLIVFTGPLFSACKMYRWTPNYEGGGPLSGTLFIPSIIRDIAAPGAIQRFISKLPPVFNELSSFKKSDCVKGCSSLTDISRMPNESLDYCFIDPPFGANLNYSELNFLWESWLRTWTIYGVEAIENSAHGKGLDEYRKLMTACFKEVYRALKPGRWMTVEFSNTKASVWNSIQTALTEAGFIVANVSVLDKKQGSFKAVTTPTAVKQDLVISAYKPNGGFEERFSREAQTEEGVWDFIRTHLKYLPVTKRQGVSLQMVPERDPRILFDQIITYFVRSGYPVPISSQEFQNGLAQRFIERDGMYFLPDQVAEYDRKKMTSGELQQTSLFVSDEASVIQWLRQLLKEKPQTFSDINPQFMQQLGGWSKNEEQLDLRELLNQNFLCYDGVVLSTT
jgi:DNA modification methylase